MCAVLRKSCDEVDADFLARPGGAADGCSAVIALLTGKRLFIASVGDAVAFLGEQSSSGDIHVTRRVARHVLTSPTELGRIRAAGGEVTCLSAKGQHVLQRRADGPGDSAREVLHVSRAFGDRNFKEGGAEETAEAKPLVIPTPDVTTTELNAKHQVIMLACSEMGVLAETEVAETLQRYRGRPRVACGSLLQCAQDKHLVTGSLTSMCVCLEWNYDAQQTVEPPAKKGRMETLAQAVPSQVRCRQILVKHKDCKEPIDKVRGGRLVTRSLAEAERILLETLQAIETNTERSVFTQRCKAVSECSTCLKGGEMAGDLGWLCRGQAHPAVETAAFALPVGHISDIVESDEGVHVLWRIA